MDDIDLRWTWISSKLKEASYSTFMLGKGHTGFKSYNHVPTQNGFDSFIGLLTGKASYTGLKLWKNGAPRYDNSISDYSTRYYREEAEALISDHLTQNPGNPFFLYFSLQTPHTPIEPPETTDVDYDIFTRKEAYPYEYMLFAADFEIGKLISFLKARDQWDNTFFVFTSDNGATTKSTGSSSGTRGSNYPLRGDKSTNFEAGVRTTAFIAGGVIPDALRGTINPVVSHIADWYATFCYLAGVDASDGPPELPITPPDDTDPVLPSITVGGVKQNIWGENSYPDSDSVNLMPQLMEPDQHDPNGLRPEGLVLGFETILLGDYKLIVAQPCK